MPKLWVYIFIWLTIKFSLYLTFILKMLFCGSCVYVQIIAFDLRCNRTVNKTEKKNYFPLTYFRYLFTSFHMKCEITRKIMLLNAFKVERSKKFEMTATTMIISLNWKIYIDMNIESLLVFNCSQFTYYRNEKKKRQQQQQKTKVKRNHIRSSLKSIQILNIWTIS